MQSLRFVVLVIALFQFSACAGGGSGTGLAPSRGNAAAASTQISAAAPSATPVAFGTPLVISAAGTYRGNWQGTTTVPAVTVNTSGSVTIEYCNLSGPGTLVQIMSSSTVVPNVNIANCTGNGTSTGPIGTAPGHFLSVSYSPTATSTGSVIVEHNLLTNTGGMVFYGPNAAMTGKIQILYNSVANIDGLPNGGGSCTENGTQPYCHRNFVELHDLFQDPNIEIAWNQVINAPDQSAMEDVILVDYASGLGSGPIRIHDNYISGAYDSKPDSTAMDYTGSGINAADGGTAADAAHVTAFVSVYDNQVVNFENYGIGISAGHDNTVVDNRIISSNLLPNGSQMGKIWTGLLVHNAYNQSPTIFYNNSATGNVVGDTYLSTLGYGLRQPDCDEMGSSPGLCSTVSPANTDFVPLSGARVMPADEAAEFASWEAKLAGRGFVVGPSP